MSRYVSKQSRGTCGFLEPLPAFSGRALTGQRWLDSRNQAIRSLRTAMVGVSGLSRATPCFHSPVSAGAAEVSALPAYALQLHGGWREAEKDWGSPHWIKVERQQGASFGVGPRRIGNAELPRVRRPPRGPWKKPSSCASTMCLRLFRGRGAIQRSGQFLDPRRVVAERLIGRHLPKASAS
jgi:hypothetical protein